MHEVANEKEVSTELFTESLLDNNIDTIFGSIENKLLPFYSSSSFQKKFKHVYLKHEQATIHAADGYARVTGKPGIAVIRSGFGLTNAVTGIATAYLDSIPMVVFVCQSSFSQSVTEEIDIEGITKPISKYNFKITTIEDINQVVMDAYSLADSGRKGPIIVELPSKFPRKQIGYNCNTTITKVKSKKKIKVQKRVINTVASEIANAKQPVILIGGGVIHAGADQLVKQLLQLTRIPFVSTLMGLEAVNNAHHQFLGMVGMHGTVAANQAVHDCDLLICLGVRFSDRIVGRAKNFSPSSKKIQIDIDPSEINKKILVDLPIIGDLKEILSLLIDKVIPSNIEKWLSEVSSLQQTIPKFHHNNSILKPNQIIQLLDEFSNETAIVATDVGQHQMWTAHHYQFKYAQSFLTSGGFGTMGYGVPAAIGACIAAPNRQVICVSGDGSFQMNHQELITAVKYQLNIKIAILKNGYLGMVRQWQQLFYKKQYSHVKISSPDLLKLAEGYGAIGLRAYTLQESKQIIEQAFKIDGPVIMEFNIEDEQNVYPIVPPGGSNLEAIDE